MKYKALQKLIFGYGFFLLCLLICVLIRPDELGEIQAISDYGTAMPTVIPYVIGFTAVALGLLGAAGDLPQTTAENRRLTQYFRILAVQSVLVMITPNTVNDVLYVVHAVFAVTLFITEAAIAAWLAARVHRDKLVFGLLGVQYISTAVTLLALEQVGIISRELVAPGQLLAVGAFSLLLLRATLAIEKVHLRELK